MKDSEMDEPVQYMKGFGRNKNPVVLEGQGGWMLLLTE